VEPDLVRRQSALDRGLSRLIRGERNSASHLLLAPATLWLIAFLVLPVVSLLSLGFTHRGPYGAFEWVFTLGNFRRALDLKYLPILARTVCYSGATTALCLLLGYPLAYFLSFQAGKKRDLFLALLMIPFWTSWLVAIYSWIIILGREGLLNGLLRALGLPPVAFLGTSFSVILGLVYFYLPFMVLPLYASLEKIPRSYVEAAHDLGAGKAQAFLKVTLPLSLPGVLAGAILTFVPCMGDFLCADFLGSPRTYLVGNLVQNQFLMAQDWQFGSALTSLLILFLISGLYARHRFEERGLFEEAE
jgi:spermidine/putrescine transport system permease protein